MIFAFARVWGERSSFPDDILDHPETACRQPSINCQGSSIDKSGFISTKEGHWVDFTHKEVLIEDKDILPTPIK